MRHSLLVASLFLLSSLAHADLAEILHQQNCGENPNCRVIVAPKKIERKGACMGIFMETLPCMVSFISVKDDAAMNLICGEDFNLPVIDQTMPAEAIGYNVATLITNHEGKDLIKNDLNEYSMFSNFMVDLTLKDSKENDVLTTTGTFIINLQGRQIPLTNVKCRN